MHTRVFLSAAIACAALSLNAPAARAQTASATVCADGTTSTAVGSGLCVGHGGVKAKSTSKVETHVTCKDGTTAEAGKGVCAEHGGVKSKTASTTTRSVTKKSTRPDDKDPTAAIALCKDGLYSHAPTRASACKEHGGVDKYLVKP